MNASRLLTRAMGIIGVIGGLALAVVGMPQGTTGIRPSPQPGAKPELSAQSAKPSAHDDMAWRSAEPARSTQPPMPTYAMPPMPRLVVPVDGVRPSQLVDTFTQTRASGARRHDAIDILAPIGAPVRSAATGFVENLHLSRDGGNTIYIRSPDRRVIYYYAHLDRYAPGLADRQNVAAGQVIGTVGYSGNANAAAPHLHFAISITTPAAHWWDRSMVVNPYPLLTAR